MWGLWRAGPVARGEGCSRGGRGRSGAGVPACPLDVASGVADCAGALPECDATVTTETRAVEVAADALTLVVRGHAFPDGCERYESFARGLGAVSFATLSYGGTLAYARVGGVTVGTAVVSREAPPEAAALALAAHPSPTAGPLAVTLAGARGPVLLEAFDALGRRVLARTVAPEARAEVDASGWAPGLYVLRATAGGAMATVRVVRR